MTCKLDLEKPLMGEKFIYRDDVLYAITIKPDNSLQFFNKPNRLAKFRNIYYEKFLNYHRYMDYVFNLEISHPIGDIKSEGPRLHLHGLFKFKSNKAIFIWLLNKMPDLLIHSQLHIFELDLTGKTSSKEWMEYMVKQRKQVPMDVFTFSNLGKPDDILCMCSKKGTT